MVDRQTPIVVTGAAGFIGAYVCRALLARGEAVVGLDNFNAYYDPKMKRDRVAALCPEITIETIDIADAAAVTDFFQRHAPTRVVHLAAQAGVRYSLESPQTYVQSNLVGFGNVLEACRRAGVHHLVYASSSSVYGAAAVAPFAEQQRVDQPLSLYAATKAANELMAYSYAHLFRLRQTGLRFFTVYGPWGRPDMAPILFTRAALAGRPITVFNHGRMRRDFTWIDDIVAGVLSALDHPPTDTGDSAPHRVFNLGKQHPEQLGHFIDLLEAAVGRPITRKYLPMQAGDMVETMADSQRAERELGFAPRVAIEQGLPELVEWCRRYDSAAALNHGAVDG